MGKGTVAAARPIRKKGSGDGPDHARGLSRAIITDWTNGPGKLAKVGDYRLEFARTPQGWRIRSIACDLVPRAG